MEIEKLREEKAAAEKEMQRYSNFDKQMQTHHMAVNRQNTEAATMEIQR